MSRFVRIGVRGLLGAVGFAVCIIVTFAFFRASLQRGLARETDVIGDRAIHVLRPVNVRGVEQWILVRGSDRNAPVLLFLHGGPGSPLLPITRWFDRRIVDDFVIVHWDQRGAGKSFSFMFKEVNVPMLIEDVCALASTLRRQLDRERIGLVGHSWGTDLGFYAIDRCPENFFGFVAMSTDVRPIEAERIGYRFVLAAAESRGNAQAIEDLREIGPPPYDSLREVLTQRRWLEEFGRGSRHDGSRSEPSYLRMAVASPEYRTLDLIRLVLGNVYSAFLMYDWIVEYVDLAREVPSVSVPVFFAQGRYDRNTPTEVVAEYFERLVASHKEISELSASAHSPHLDETDQFARFLQEKLLPLAPGRAAAQQGAAADRQGPASNRPR